MEPKPQTSCVDASKQRSGYRQCITQEVPSWNKHLDFSGFLLFHSSFPLIVCFLCSKKSVHVTCDSVDALRKTLPSIWGFVSAKWKGRAEFLHLRFLWIRGGLEGTRLGKRTTLVKTVRIFQTKHLWSMVNWQLNPEPSNTVSVSQWDAKTGEEKPNSCVLGLFLIYLPYVTTFLKHFWEIQTDVVGLIYIKIRDMSCGYSVFTVASIRCKCVGHMLSMLSQTQELCTTFNFRLYYIWQQCG